MAHCSAIPRERPGWSSGGEDCPGSADRRETAWQIHRGAGSYGPAERWLVDDGRVALAEIGGLSFAAK